LNQPSCGPPPTALRQLPCPGPGTASQGACSCSAPAAGRVSGLWLGALKICCFGRPRTHSRSPRCYAKRVRAPARLSPHPKETMLSFSTWSPLVGGALIGLSASLFLLAHGRVAGISGLFGSLLCRTSSAPLVRMTFIAGLVVGGIALGLLLPQVFATSWSPSLPHALVAGLLVGVGTQLSSGCTSGHGICGITRGSLRSFVATGTFMLTGFVTVFLVRHALGGAP